MVTNREMIQSVSTTQEFAKWVAVFMQSGKLNPDVDYESSLTWVKIMKWLEEPANE